MRDWLGNDYFPGDKVIYAAGSGRSITMVLAEVLSIYKVYRDDDTYEWVHVAIDDPVPFKRKWNQDTRQETLTTEPVDTELRVSLQPLKSSRWKQHYGKTRYIDTRTGKGIDPFCSSRKHLDGGYYENESSGARVYKYSYPGRVSIYDHPEFEDFRYYPYEKHFGHPDSTPKGWKFVREEFKPYVKKVEEGPGPVTLTVTENIVKWHSDDVVDWA